MEGFIEAQLIRNLFDRLFRMLEQAFGFEGETSLDHFFGRLANMGLHSLTQVFGAQIERVGILIDLVPMVIFLIHHLLEVPQDTDLTLLGAIQMLRVDKGTFAAENQE